MRVGGALLKAMILAQSKFNLEMGSGKSFCTRETIDVARGAVGSKALMGWIRPPPRLAVVKTRWLARLNIDPALALNASFV